MRQFLSKQNEFANVNEILNEIINEINENQKNINDQTYISKLVWENYLMSHYEISKIAIAILSICPSESCVERSFSIQSDVHTKDRNRMQNDLIDAEMNIKYNL